MGYRATAIVSFGIDFEEQGDRFWKEDLRVPWMTEEWEHDGIEEWWLREVLGFDLDFYDFYDKEARETIEPEYTEKYLKTKRELRKNKPCPVEWTLHGTDACPSYILGVQDSVTTVDWGETKPISPSSLFTLDKENLDLFNDFCKEHLSEFDLPEPEWLMTVRYW